MVTDIQLNSESVDAPVREGDVLGSVTVSYAGEILGQTKLLAITDVARSEFSSAAAGTEAYIQKNWWKWVVIAIFAAIGVILVLIVLYQLRKRATAASAWSSAAAHWRTSAAASARATTCRSMSWNNGKGGRFIC